MTCYTCEKGIVPTITAEVFNEAKKSGNIPQEWLTNETKKAPFKITYFLFLTNECNLRCSYCYATKTPRVMKPETLEQVKRFIADFESRRISGPRDVTIQFFGGEPTMYWDVLEDFIVNFSAMYQGIHGQKIHWGMTTNGTLLDRRRLSFMKLYDMKPLLSIDGRRETHDLHRKKVNGSGSFDDIPIDLIREFFPNCEIRPTITPETVEDWDKDLEWFHSQGFYTVATEVAYEREWDSHSFEKARKLYEKLADKYVAMRKAGQKFWMKFIDDSRNCIGQTRKTGPVCGIARNSVAIDADGDLFSCQRFASFSDKSLALGNVFDGFNQEKLQEANNLRREEMSPVYGSGFDCNDCVALWRCMGGCNAMNYQVCGDRRNIPANFCKFQRMWAEIGLLALARTGELWTALNKKQQCSHK